jgi:hypothetical protein
MTSLASVGYILALVGGVILALFGFVSWIGNTILLPFTALATLGSAAHGFITLVIGIIAMIGSKYVSRLDWGIVLLILGIVAGGLGGTLVFLGALLGLISRFIKEPR